MGIPCHKVSDHKNEFNLAKKAEDNLTISHSALAGGLEANNRSIFIN